MARVVDPTTGEVLDPKTSEELYYLSNIRKRVDVWTPENIRAEYSRLRRIVNSRLKTIEKDPIGRSSLTYKMNIGKYKPVDELKLGEMKILLSQAARMVAAKRGTLAGIKAARTKAIKSFHQHGYKFINQKNLDLFGEFMEAVRASSLWSYGSIVAADMYETAIKNNIPPDEVKAEFDKFLEQRPKKKSAEERGADVEKAFERLLLDDS